MPVAYFLGRGRFHRFMDAVRKNRGLEPIRGLQNVRQRISKVYTDDKKDPPQTGWIFLIHLKHP